MNALQRCSWPGTDKLMTKYHDVEWGVPVHRDRKLFEFLVLESAQAGLSWRTILYRRKGYQEAFENFDPLKVARFSSKHVLKLLQNPGIIRNKAKIEATINNAQRFIQIQEEFGSFDDYSWRFVEGKPLINRWKSTKDLPSNSRESDSFAKDLKQRGFKFLGSTVIYAHMQAVGMVNDHLVDCFRWKEVCKLHRQAIH